MIRGVRFLHPPPGGAETAAFLAPAGLSPPPTHFIWVPIERSLLVTAPCASPRCEKRPCQGWTQPTCHGVRGFPFDVPACATAASATDCPSCFVVRRCCLWIHASRDCSGSSGSSKQSHGSACVPPQQSRWNVFGGFRLGRVSEATFRCYPSTDRYACSLPLKC